MTVCFQKLPPVTVSRPGAAGRGPVSVPDHVESAALGAAILAGRGAGVLLPGAAADDPPGAARVSLGPGRVAYPSPAGQQAYDLLYERWATCRRGI